MRPRSSTNRVCTGAHEGELQSRRRAGALATQNSITKRLPLARGSVANVAVHELQSMVGGQPRRGAFSIPAFAQEGLYLKLEYCTLDLLTTVSWA